MTTKLPPLPEPVIIGMEEVNFNEFEPRYGYTEAQFKQAVKDALEQAAQVAERGFKYAKDGDQIADAIREIKEQI